MVVRCLRRATLLVVLLWTGLAAGQLDAGVGHLEPAPPADAAAALPTPSAAGAGTDLEHAARALLDEVPPTDAALHSVVADGSGLTVCLEVSLDALAAEGWLGIELIQAEVARTLTSLPWQQLSVQRHDPASGLCTPLSDYAPSAAPALEGLDQAPSDILPRASGTELAPYDGTVSGASTFGSLKGKTVYLSAGHGWNWTGSSWKTQRIVYQGFIEDHNNAEVVTQYLIPYLENAGATVIPVRERDWSAARVIADNDQGAPVFTVVGDWPTSSGTGYAGLTYRFATTVNSATPSAVATWTLNVPAAGRYAVYAWVYPSSNRSRDAHYTVHHAGGATLVTIDQLIYPQTWRYLGTFPFNAGAASVTLDNRSASPETRAVIADAIRLGGGQFDTLSGLSLLVPTSDTPLPAPGAPPYKPWWETATFYWSQWMGLRPSEWPYLNDVVARPIYARWNQRASGAASAEDAVYISWHTNGSTGAPDAAARGTVSYVHNNDTYPRTPGSTELQAAVHNELIHDIHAGWDPAWKDRGQGQLNLGELRMLWDADYAHARIPGVLLEIAFHDNYEDALALKEPAFNQLAARAVYQGIVKYFEARDGTNLTLAPEPPTHLRVENTTPGTLRVAWQSPPTDGVGLRGEAATGYRVYTSPDGFAWRDPTTTSGTETLLTGLGAGETVYVRVTATNAGGESLPTEVLGARVGDARLLLVNGFDKLNRFGLVTEADPQMGENLRMWLDRMNSRAYVVHHGQAVPTGYAWDSASNEAVAAGHVTLGAYDVVDWILGEESTVEDFSFNATERARVTAYVNAGNALMVSGSEFGWDLVGAGTDPSFMRTVLRADYVADDAATYTARPVAGGAFQGLSDLHFDAPGEYDVDYPDVLAPFAGAQTALTYAAGVGGTAATQYANGCQRLLVLGFPFEALRPAERGPAMAAALAYLDACGGIDTTIISPTANGYYNTMPTVNGTATGSGLTSVQVQVVRSSDGLYWNGSAWTGSAVWLGATGVQAWSYVGLPALADGRYTLRARAVGVAVDETPAEVVFTLDRIPPGLPNPLAPAEGSLITTPAVVFWWTVPSDSGSPLSFELAIDTRTYTTAVTPYVAAAREGTHAWRVRAVDAAGNVGPWCDWINFEVDVEEVFVPLVHGTH